MTTTMSAAMPTADFGTRFSAFVIDALLLFLGQWVIYIVLSRQLQAVGLTSTEPCVPDAVALCAGPSTLLWALLLTFLVVSTVGYHAVFEGVYGATPGKRWMGLAVVDHALTSPIGLSAGILRSLVRQAFWLSLLFVFDVSPLALGLPAVFFIGLPALALGGFVWGAFSADGRAVHDVVAKTSVVRTDQVSILGPPNIERRDAVVVEESLDDEPSGNNTPEPENSEEPV